MNYSKPFFTVNDQIKTLKNRKLIIDNESFAFAKLSSISYYRLRAYTYPFQDNNDENHLFIKQISFEEIILLYDFDSKLRSLLFDSVEKIEIAFRTQIIYHFSETYGSHWQIEPNIYRDSSRFISHIQSLSEEIKRSDETFIKHYFQKYSSPTQPPSWMSIEVASLGLLSKIYQNLKSGNEKLYVALYFGLKKVEILENWMLCISNLRNICAHHGRVWNRRYTAKPFLPYNTAQPFLTKQEIQIVYTNKLYATLCCIYYMSLQIDSKTTFKTQLLSLMNSCPLKQEKEMGFPLNWKSQTLWK
jgi:abortive infection bacteriophage resistance protein